MTERETVSLRGRDGKGKRRARDVNIGSKVDKYEFFESATALKHISRILATLLSLALELVYKNSLWHAIG